MNLTYEKILEVKEKLMQDLEEARIRQDKQERYESEIQSYAHNWLRSFMSWN